MAGYGVLSLNSGDVQERSFRITSLQDKLGVEWHSRGMRRGLIGLLLLPSLLMALPADAAVVSGFTNAEDAVLYDGCRNSSIEYSATLPAETSDWNLSISVLGPDGLESGSDYVYGDGPSASGTASHQLCSFEDTGRYTVEAEGEWCDSDYNCYPFTLPTSSFRVRLAKTRVTLAASDYTAAFNQKITLRVVTRDERPNGLFPSDSADVVLQVKNKGQWVKVTQSDIYIDNGRGSITYRWNVRKKVMLRAYRKAEDNTAKSYSKPITIR